MNYFTTIYCGIFHHDKNVFTLWFFFIYLMDLNIKFTLYNLLYVHIQDLSLTKGLFLLKSSLFISYLKKIRKCWFLILIKIQKYRLLFKINRTREQRYRSWVLNLYYQSQALVIIVQILPEIPKLGKTTNNRFFQLC